MKDFRPQVFFGTLVLGAMGTYALSLGVAESVPLACIAGIVYAVKVLSNGKGG